MTAEANRRPATEPDRGPTENARTLERQLTPGQWAAVRALIEHARELESLATALDRGHEARWHHDVGEILTERDRLQERVRELERELHLADQKPDMDMECVTHGLVPHRWRPSPEAGPHWRCSECGEPADAEIDRIVAARADAPAAEPDPHGESAREAIDGATLHECAMEHLRPVYGMTETMAIGVADAILAAVRELERTGRLVKP